MKNQVCFTSYMGVLAMAAALLGGTKLSAEDITFNGTGTVRLLAQDWVDYIGGSATFNVGVNDGGRLYWRGSAGDGQYMHFDLTRLSGLTVYSAAAVTLQNALPNWGGSVTDSFIATNNGAWRAVYGTAIPGSTAIGDATNATGDYGSGASVTWSIGSSTFQGYVDNAASFSGLAIIGGASSTLHFNAPMNPFLDVDTSASMSGVVTVSGGGAWNSGNYSFINGVLYINDSVAGGESGAGAVTIHSPGTVFVNGNSGDNRYWAIDSTAINAGGVLMIEGHSHLHNLTLAGGELAGIRPNGNYGGWTLDDATTVTGNSTISAQQMNLDNGTFTVGTGLTLNLPGSIRSGKITKEGEGAMVLSGNNGSSGGIIINGGSLEATRSAQDHGIHTLGTGPLTINNGGTLRSTANWTTSSEWNGTSVGALTINQGGTWSIEAGPQSIRNGLYMNGGTLTATGPNADWGALHLKSEVTAGDGINPTTSSIAADTALNGGRTITVHSGCQLNYSGVIHNQYGMTGAITKNGEGSLVLSAANGYSGVTDVTAGTLVAANNAALGWGGWNGATMTTVRNGATLTLQGGISINEHMHVAGAGAGGVGAIRSLSGNNALTLFNGGGSSGPGYAIDANTTIGVDADTLTITGFYESGGSFSLIKVGAGTLVCSSVNSYSGDTIVSNGTLRLSKACLADGSTVRIADGATLDLAFAGWDTVTAVELGGVLYTAPGVYNNSTYPAYFDGDGSLIITQTWAWDGAASTLWNTGDVNWTGSVWADLVYNTALFANPTAQGTITLIGPRTAGTLKVGNGGNNASYTFNGDALNITDSVIVQGAGPNDPGVGTTTFSGMTTVITNDLRVGRWDLRIDGGTTTVGGQILGSGDWGRVFIQNSAVVTAAGGFESAGLVCGLTVKDSTFNTAGIRASKNTYGNGSRLGFDNALVVATKDNDNFMSVDGGTAEVDAGGLRLDKAGHALTIGTTINGSGTFTMIGTGTLTITGSSSPSGGTVADAGTLVLPGNGGWGRIGGVLTVNTTATVVTTGDGTGLGYNGQLSKLVINGGLVTSAGANHIWHIAQGIQMTGGTLQSNNGTDTLDGAQLEWGNTAVNTLACDDSATIAGRIRIRGEQNSAVAFNVADGAAAADLVVSAYVTETQGGCGITKSGSGTMVLSRTPAYSGTTAVNEGTLVVGGSIPTLTVAANAKVSPGTAVNSVGTLSPSSLTLASGASLLMDVAAANGVCDTVTLTGDIDVSGLTVEVNALETMPFKNTYVLLTANSITGTPKSVAPYPWRVKVAGNTLLLSVQGTLISFQ